MYAFVILYLMVADAQCQSSFETTEMKANAVTLEIFPQEQEFLDTSLASNEGEQTEQTTTALVTEDFAPETEGNSIQLEGNHIRGEIRPPTTQQTPTNQNPNIPSDLSQDEQPTVITIGLPTGTDGSVLFTEEKTTPVPTCGENEVYDCLPLCPRRCSLLSKIVCRKLPTFIQACHKGCTCRPGYSLDRTTDTCIKHC